MIILRQLITMKPILFILIFPLLNLELLRADAAEDPATVQIQTIKKEEASDLLIFPARTYSRVQTNLYAEYEGNVQTLPPNVGQKVERHGLLMTIQNTDPVYQYAPVKVLSPVSGVVSAMDVKQGTHVTKGQLLGSITDPSKLRVTIEVPAQDLNSIQAGEKGEFKAANFQSLPVKVLGVSPLIDPKTGTSTADLEIIQTSVLPAGLVGQVMIKSGTRQAMMIAEDSVIYRDSKPMLRLLIDHKMKLAPVELGRSNRGMIEIKSGIEAGQIVIMRTSRYLSEGEIPIVEGNMK